MMKEFMAYEFVDGDVKVFVREQGYDNDWTLAGTVQLQDRSKPPEALAWNLDLTGLSMFETKELARELAQPRRHR